MAYAEPHVAPEFKPCPDEEGIKTLPLQPNAYYPEYLNLALMKKGLRPHSSSGQRPVVGFKPCPDEEGIKTGLTHGLDALPAFKPCPDEEGIKTSPTGIPFKKIQDLNLALMKKGLSSAIEDRSAGELARTAA